MASLGGLMMWPFASCPQAVCHGAYTGYRRLRYGVSPPPMTIRASPEVKSKLDRLAVGTRRTPGASPIGLPHAARPATVAASPGWPLLCPGAS